MKTNRTLALPGALILAAGIPTAIAQTDDQTTATVLAETVVTASRVETPIEQVGSAISVITAEELERRQVTYVADALRLVPGVTVTRSGGPGTLTNVRLRGADNNHTLVLIDGIEVNDPAFGSVYDFGNLLVSDIERIEVLRGPQSALWGSDAIGGVINIITRRGTEGPPRVHASLEGGSFNTWQITSGVRGGTANAHYALGLTHLDTDGTNIAREGDEDDGHRNSTVTFTGGVQATDTLAFDLVTRYTRALSETDPQEFSFPPGPNFGRVVDGDDVNRNEQFYGRAVASLDLLEGAWQHRVGAAVTDTRNEFLSDGVRTNQTDGRVFKLDYQSSYLFSTGAADHTVVFAAEREEEKFRQRGETPDAPSNQDQSMVNKGLIGEYRVGLWEQLFLSGALRRDFNDRFRDATTYRLTAAWLHPDTGTRIHSSYGTGVTNPTFIELFGFFPDTFQGNPDLGPEKARGWDLGVEHPFLDGRVVVDVTYFRSVLTDEIVTTFDPDTFISSVTNGDGRSRRSGVEVSARAALSDQLDLTASYTYLRATNPDGEREVRRPRHTASATLDYRFRDLPASFFVQAAYTGSQLDLDFADSPPGRVTLDAYTLVTVGGRYRIGRDVELFARIENLLDEEYENVLSYSTPGRAAYMGIRAEF